MNARLSRARLAVIGIVVLLTACAGSPVRLSTTDQVPPATEIDRTSGRQVSASASGFQLLLLVPININDRQQRAFELLAAQAGGDYLTNISVEESWTWALVGTVYTTRMTATAYRRTGEAK